jgi:hypothetical protein
MDSEEIKKELAMTYAEMVTHLLSKYGKAEHDYFRNETCKSKNPNVSRTCEGLYCHHIDEDKAIMLAEDKFAANNPFAYQKADRLVYCNVLEHLILHIKIMEKPKDSEANEYELQGIGGVYNYMCPQINDYFNGYIFKQQWVITAFNLIENNFEDYIKILKYLFRVAETNSLYTKIIRKEKISVGWNKEIVKKVYKRL